jgi:hypothetical protein
MRHSAAPSPVDLRRRDFLIRCCQGSAAALIPSGLTGLGWPLLYSFDAAANDLSSREFYLHPRYRTPRPLDALLLKTQAGHDDFLTEKYADEIAAILAKWSSSLLQSASDMSTIEKVLAPEFSGSSLRSTSSQIRRRQPAIFVSDSQFTAGPALGKSEFVRAARSVTDGVAEFLTAEFQVTSIDVASTPSSSQLSPVLLHTRIR